MRFEENIDIDLSKGDRPEVPVKVEWEIEVPEPKGFFKSKFFKKYGKLEKEVSVGIDNLELDGRVVVNGMISDLVYLRSQGEKGTRLDFKLKELSTYCRVIVNPAAINDCTEREKAFDRRRPYPLNFNVVLYDGNGREIEKHQIQINLNFSQVQLSPIVRLSLEEEFTYSSACGLTEIGSILVSSPVPQLQYTPGIDVKLNLRLNGTTTSVPTDAVHIGSPEGGNSYSIDNLVPDDLRCKEVLGRKEMVLPIYLDMRRLSNPLIPKETLHAVCTWSYHHNYNQAEFLSGDNVMESIDFLQDSQGAELIVQQLNSDDMVVSRISNGQSITLPVLEFFAEGSTVTDRKFRLSNLATDTSRAGAGVKIAGLTVTETIEGAQIKGRHDEWVTELFDKSDRAISELSSSTGWMLRNGQDSHIDFQLTFDPAQVLNVFESHDFRFYSILSVEFDYIENSTGKAFEEMLPEHFRFEIRQPLYLKPNPRWLCIDYGSSAIVCKYDEKVLELRTRKSSILKKALGKDNQAFLVDNLENGTEFLSSDIVLHTPLETDKNTTVSSLCSEQSHPKDANYDKLAVLLSPTSSMIVHEVLRQLPCLKLLVGNELLPPNADYQTFAYEIDNPNGGLVKVTAEGIRETNPEKSLVVIDNVFRESYEAFLNYFVIPEVKNVNLINRLVLTYPNTYTPRHLDTLRSIVKKAIPAVRELSFVSESDAVAAYYLENWGKYHPADADPKTQENILVFDMGAGTLDLSLIQKSTDSERRMTMEIVAKIGTCKAGNYLDFVLAEIVCDLIGEKGKGGMALASTQRAASAEIGKERSRLKNFIKNELKPRLNSSNRAMVMSFTSENGEPYESFTVGKVLDDKRFVDFLEVVTHDILTQLANFAGSDRPKVNTVLMSGRSSLLVPLRDHLTKAVNVFNNGSANTEYIRLDEPLNGKRDISRQKVAVTEGAMAIMSRNYRSENSLRRIASKRVYASFGVAYQDFGKWQYVELLSYREIPANLQGEYNGKRIHLPNLNNIPTLVVLQSYLDADATAKALNDDRWDYIAQMERITLDGQSGEDLMMKINTQNNVVLYIGQQRTRGQVPKGDDLTSEAIKRSVWPVTI